MRSLDYVMSDVEIAVLSGMVFNIISSSGPGGTIEPSGSIPVAWQALERHSQSPLVQVIKSQMFWLIISHMEPFQNSPSQM